MGLNEVYQSLLDIFPQIDARVLRAVAIEHEKDPNAAVEAVLAEIIPSFVERSGPSSPSIGGGYFVGESSGAIANVKPESQTLGSLSMNAQGSSSTEAQNGCVVNDENEQSDDECIGPTHNAGDEKNAVNPSQAEVFGEPGTGDSISGKNCWESSISGDPGTGDSISGENFLESSKNISSDDIPSHSPENFQEVDKNVDENMHPIQEREETPCNVSNKCIMSAEEENNLRKASADDGNNKFNRTTSLTIHVLPNSPMESIVQLEELPDMHECKKLRASVSGDIASKLETTNSFVGLDDVSTSSMAVSESNQMQAIAVLEDLIARAKNNKEALFSAMKPVVSLMMEVELKEEAAERAKAEAEKAGARILYEVQELKQMLQHAREANDMNAGDVYGEKAILATELRELRARTLSLSDERDKALRLLDQMHETLKERLAAADNEINSAEQEKLEKEEASQKSHTDLELVMEKIVQESKILKQQAEVNSKVHEFLVDQGCVVDTLQGEMAVICQDVRLFKEKLSEHVPLSNLLLSIQTSFIFASSKSIIQDQVEQVLDAATDPVQIKRIRDHDQVAEEEAERADRNKLSDDGWHILDEQEIYT